MKFSIVSVFLIFIFVHSVNAQKFNPGFFCFEDAFLLSPDYTIENRAYLLRNLGFDGIELEGLDNVTKKNDRKNVGAVFNLCHFLKTDDRGSLEKSLKASVPYLSAVSINGADDGETKDMDWSRLIQPLGKGSFDVLNILRILRDNNYSGPVGLQCYDIKGDPSEFLKISADTWHKYINELERR